METFVNIAKGAPDSVFWFRKSSQIAVIRIKRFFRKKAIAAERLIFSCDVPGQEHRERIQHADAVLDSRFYGGHTTCSDALIEGVPYFALKGEFFQSRVSYSLVKNHLGATGDELICSSLEDLQAKAIYFATDGRERLQEIRAEIKSKVESRSGICDGDSWIRDFEWGLGEFVNIRKKSGKLPDLFLYEPIDTRPTRREFIVLPQEGGLKADRMETEEKQPCCHGTFSVQESAGWSGGDLGGEALNEKLESG
jgi:hypothetical protein